MWQAINPSSIISIIIVGICMIIGLIYNILFMKTIHETSKTQTIQKAPTYATTACTICYELGITFCFISFLQQAQGGGASYLTTYLFLFMYLVSNLLMILVFIYRIDYPFRTSVLYQYSQKTLKAIYYMFIFMVILILWLAICIAILNEIKVLVWISGAIFGITLVSLSIALFIMFTSKLKQMHRNFTKITYSSIEKQEEENNLEDLLKLIRKFTVLYILTIASTFFFIFVSLAMDAIFEDTGHDLEYFIARLMFIFDSIIGILTMYFTIKQHTNQYYKCCGCIDRCFDKTCNQCDGAKMNIGPHHVADITLTMQSSNATATNITATNETPLTVQTQSTNTDHESKSSGYPSTT